MTNFLQDMARGSASRAHRAMVEMPMAEMRAVALSASLPIPLKLDRFGVIAEVKRASPSQGSLSSADIDIVAQAQSYADAGAAMISVLTEPTRFGGDASDLRVIAAAVNVPVMRKDFLVEPYQVYEARAWGASAVLLITRMLDDGMLARMFDTCEKLSLGVLLEAFDADDLERSARAIEGRSGVLLGLNCRDLATLHEDPGRFQDLAGAFPNGVARIAESGISTADHAANVAHLGYDGVLVGTALMRSADPGTLVRSMIDAGRSSRG